MKEKSVYLAGHLDNCTKYTTLSVTTDVFAAKNMYSLINNITFLQI